MKCRFLEEKIDNKFILKNEFIMRLSKPILTTALTNYEQTPVAISELS